MAKCARIALSEGVYSLVGFNYRRVPAIALARDIIRRGDIGELLHGTVDFHQDFLLDPDYPLTWRLDPVKSGSGPAHDLGAHAIDVVHYLFDDAVVEVSSRSGRLAETRPVATSSVGIRAEAGSSRGRVGTDDFTTGMLVMSKGQALNFSLSRVAAGRKCLLKFSVFGSKGSISFDFDRFNELSITRFPADLSGTQEERILVTEDEHPYAGNWWSPGHPLGYDHTHVDQIGDFIESIELGIPPSPSFEDGLKVQKVVESIQTSSIRKSWVSVQDGDTDV